MGYFYLAVIKAGGYLRAAYVLMRVYHSDAHLRMWIVMLTRLLLRRDGGAGIWWAMDTRNAAPGNRQQPDALFVGPVSHSHR